MLLPILTTYPILISRTETWTLIKRRIELNNNNNFQEDFDKGEWDVPAF